LAFVFDKQKGSFWSLFLANLGGEWRIPSKNKKDIKNF